MLIKCIGCYDLFREEVEVEGKPLMVYICPRFFPYSTVISGLIRPGKGITEALKLCPERIDEHCILCAKTELVSYGQQIVFTCKDHYQAWSKWLDEHPERRDYLHSPHGRAKKANWIEVFREFIEDMRTDGKPESGEMQ